MTSFSMVSSYVDTSLMKNSILADRTDRFLSHDHGHVTVKTK